MAENDYSIGDGPTMRPKNEHGVRGAFAPGDVIAGRYVVERTLGEGGMGIVYQCLDKVGGVSVAVKCLPPEVSRNADEMDDIRANYRLVADLHHQNIAGARTLEKDEATGDYCLVMDLARGMSLKQWMKRNPQSTTEAKLAILRQVSAALAKALAKEPNERFASCGAVVDALEGRAAPQGGGTQVDGGGRVRSPSGPQPVGSRVPRDRTGGPRSVAAAKGLLAAALIAALAGGAWWWLGGQNGTAGTNGTTRTAKAPVSDVSSVPDVPSPVPRNGECRTFTLPGDVEMEMIYVAPGSFMMGSSSGDKDETPHQVRITKPYWIGKYPVTQAQWKALVMANGVSFEKGEPTPYFSREGKGSDRVSGMNTSDFPMEGISWDDCDALVKALNRNTTDGRTYSLPTEAQWEFAARGGTKSCGYTYSGGNDMDALGWYYENSGLRQLSDSDWKVENLSSNKCRTHSVKEKDVGNELGIVGMSGNVWEWCSDWYGDYPEGSVTDPKGPASGDSRVLRGGSWGSYARFCRSASRGRFIPGYRVDIDGFRLCTGGGCGECGRFSRCRRGRARGDSAGD